MRWMVKASSPGGDGQSNGKLAAPDDVEIREMEVGELLRSKLANAKDTYASMAAHHC